MKQFAKKTFIHHFTFLTDIHTVPPTKFTSCPCNRTVSLDVNILDHETIKQKNNMGIIDDDIRIK